MPSKDAMASKDSAGGGRRKSMSFLSIASFGGLPFIDTNIAKKGEESEDNEKKEKKKSSKRNSISPSVICQVLILVQMGKQAP
jgi:hypothetical protein